MTAGTAPRRGAGWGGAVAGLALLLAACGIAACAEADALLDRLRAGADFGDLARRHSLRPAAVDVGGGLGPVTRDQVGHLGGPLFAAPPGAVLGPFGVAGRYVLLQRGATVPPAP